MSQNSAYLLVRCCYQVNPIISIPYKTENNRNLNLFTCCLHGCLTRVFEIRYILIYQPIFIRKVFGATRHLSAKLGVKWAIRHLITRTVNCERFSLRVDFKIIPSNEFDYNGTKHNIFAG